MPYAERTKVDASRTRVQIEKLLEQHKAQRFAVSTESDRAAIMFDMADRRVKFIVAFPAGARNPDQLKRQRWRALFLCIKAKLESVDSRIETFEEAFLAHVMMPDGKTVAEHALPAIATAYQGGPMPPLLPGPN